MSDEFLRVDKWLWHARLFKSRSLAARLCTSGRLRVNGTLVSKAHHRLKPGDVLTFPKGHGIRIVRVCVLGERRGPAAEAQLLYEDLSAPTPPIEPSPPLAGAAGDRERGSGRPTKAERRAVDRLRARS